MIEAYFQDVLAAKGEAGVVVGDLAMTKTRAVFLGYAECTLMMARGVDYAGAAVGGVLGGLLVSLAFRDQNRIRIDSAKRRAEERRRAAYGHSLEERMEQCVFSAAHEVGGIGLQGEAGLTITTGGGEKVVYAALELSEADRAYLTRHNPNGAPQYDGASDRYGFFLKLPSPRELAASLVKEDEGAGATSRLGEAARNTSYVDALYGQLKGPLQKEDPATSALLRRLKSDPDFLRSFLKVVERDRLEEPAGAARLAIGGILLLATLAIVVGEWGVGLKDSVTKMAWVLGPVGILLFWSGFRALRRGQQVTARILDRLRSPAG